MLNLKVISENSDGTANVVFDFDKHFEEYYLKESGKTEVNDAEIGEFIKKMITGAFENQDDVSDSPTTS